MFTGVAPTKNSLGQLCLYAGLYFAWNLVYGRREQRLRIAGLPVEVLFLAMIVWLLDKADSATSFVCLGLGIGLFLVGRMPMMMRKPSRILNVGTIALLVFGVLESTVDISSLLVSMLGRDPSLTTRVPMWEGLQQMAGNPLIGVGYESFWSGNRLLVLWERYGRLNQSHNGYLETYLNVGLIGLTFLLLSIVSALFMIRGRLRVNYPAAMLQLSFVVVVAVYNWTEASFHGINNMWLLFFLGSLDTSGHDPTLTTSVSPQPANRPHVLRTRTHGLAAPARFHAATGRQPSFPSHVAGDTASRRGARNHS